MDHDSKSKSQNSTTTAQTPTSSRAPTNPPPSPQGIPKNTDIGTCVCNLILNKCDINCCCDEDCTDFDREAFSGCIDLPSRYDGKSCTKEYFISRSNTGSYQTETTGDFFCVFKDNYKERNYYTQPDLLRTEDDFKKRLSKVRRYTFKRGEENLQLDKIDRYKSGSLILTVSNSSVISYMSQPSPSHNQECLDGNPAEFLIDKTFSCNRKITNFKEDCTGIEGLNAQYYYKNFTILRTPRIPTNVDDILNPPYSFPISCNKSNNDLNCFDGDLPEPQLNCSLAKCTCENVVETIFFKVYHESDTNSTRIVSVKISAILKTISEEDTFVGQTHTFDYLESRRESSESDIFIKSGNPGYLRGKPILAGKLEDVSQPDGSIKQIINLSQDRNNWLTMLASLPGGKCAVTTDRVPIKFGENMRTGCLYQVTKSQLDKECLFIQDYIIQALMGENVTISGLQNWNRYIATFGNTFQTVTADWIQVVIINRPSGTPQSNPGICSGVVTSVHIQIAYANIGSLNNPQSRIVGVAYRFPQQTTSIKYQCSGLYCQPGTENQVQNFEISSSVEFVDISGKAEGVEAATPKLKQRLPEDFFYPFL
ncbi:DgyrCDS3780 [Dimorphilus gyrociliatus]|uniref:DgyrCDS3780 n=1 Tax=Dimorphilus gyrociliatus TaxID=2664684 RepID=A0A7I8VJJ7_9ANNE|nr:DgyrCDS3780 [Dimorphilus gyrociliatus]